MLFEVLFEEGNILYFKPFFFEDGGSKPKYFIVLRRTHGGVVLAGLPTSKDHVPESLAREHGCIEAPEINFNCYYFKAGRTVGRRVEAVFSFPRDTFVYGFRISEFSLMRFEEQVASGSTSIEKKGKLFEGEFDALLLCLKNSRSVKRRYKRLL